MCDLEQRGRVLPIGADCTALIVLLVLLLLRHRRDIKLDVYSFVEDDATPDMVQTK